MPGSICDVSGVRVGHHQRLGRGWQTGTTIVLVERGAVPGVDVRGGGPGTRETDALAPENLVHEIHAVCLTGGSAFGLAAADGAMLWLEERGLGFPVGQDPPQVVPIVPAAVIFDLGRGGTPTCRPTAEFGSRAISAAAGRRTPAFGAVGAGTGARAGGLQGGVGTASTVVALPADDGVVVVTVGALAVVNSNGAVVDPSTALPWEPDGFGLVAPTRRDANRLRKFLDQRPAASLGARSLVTDVAPVRSGGAMEESLNTTIGVVACDARLDKAEAGKVASTAHDGLARAIRPAHSMTDGDTVFTLATGEVELPDTLPRHAALNALLEASARVFAQACTHAVLSATQVGDSPAHRSLVPSAYRSAAL